jgi:coenzyme F420-dependent glucose-6-phosphate dehydrogenase
VLDTDDIAESVVCGPDPERRHRTGIQEYVDAGYDHVYVHQIGPEQDGFFDFYERKGSAQLQLSRVRGP